jgi:hypothetical protein
VDRLRQEKTGNLVEIPVHPALATIIAQTPIAGQLTFLTSVTGAAFSSASFGNVFRDWCDEAELPKRCSSHGLRKAACRRLAEALLRTRDREHQRPREPRRGFGDTPAPSAVRSWRNLQWRRSRRPSRSAAKRRNREQDLLHTFANQLANLPVTY